MTGFVSEHWFWFVMTVAVMVWYSTVTVYVTIKGARDIKHMLRDLRRDHERREVHG
jgi:hypothetical protein